MAVQIGSLFVSMAVDMAPFARGMARAADSTRSATAQIQRSAGAAEASVARLRNTMAGKGGGGMNPYAMLAASRAFESLNSRTDLLRAALLSTTAAFGGLAATMTSNVWLRYADTATKISNSLRVVSKDTADVAASQRALAAAANDSRANMQASATLYSRILKSSPARGQDQALRFTTTIQKALQLGGSSAQEAASAMIQLSQGLASNRLGGEELRAVLETPLGLELARGLDVTIGKFREMGTAGELTADTILDALAKIGPSIDQQFSQAGRTLDQALTVADNNVTNYIGSVNEAYGVTQKLGDAIIFLSENLDTMASVTATAALAFGSMFAGRALGGAVSRKAGEFKAIGVAAQENFQKATDEVKKLETQIKSLNSQRIQVQMQRLDPVAAFGDPAAIKSIERAVEQLARKEQQRNDSLQRFGELTRQIMEVTATGTTRAIRAADQQAAAEARVLSLQKELIAARERRASLERVEQRAPGTTRKFQAQNADNIARIRKEMAEQQQIVQASQDRINSFTVAAEERAAKQRLEISRKLTAERIKLAELERQIIGERQNIQNARSSVDVNAALAGRNALRELEASQRAMAGALATASEQMKKAEFAASAAGRQLQFLRNQGAAVLGLFGGPMGAAFTTLIATLGFFGAEAAKAAAESDAFVARLEQMGLLAPKAKSQIDALTTSIKDLRAEEAAQLAERDKAQVESRRTQAMFLGARVGQRGLDDDLPENARKAAAEIEQLAYQFGEGKIQAEAVIERLDALGKMKLGGQINPFISELRDLVVEAQAGEKAVAQFEKQANAASGANAEFNFRSGPGDDFEKWELRQQFIKGYREELGRTERDARILAETEKILKDEGFEAGRGQEALARHLATMKIDAEDAAESLKKHTAEVQAYQSKLEDMGAFVPQDMINRAMEDPFDPKAAAAREKYITDIRELNQLSKAGPTSDLVLSANDDSLRNERLTALMAAYRKEMNLTAREAEVLAIKLEILSNEEFTAAGMTEPLAAGLAEQKVKAREAAEEAVKSADSFKEMAAAIDQANASLNMTDMTDSVLKNVWGGPEEDAARQRWLDGLTLANQLLRQLPFAEEISAVISEPFKDDSLNQFVENYRAQLAMTDREAAILAETTRLLTLEQFQGVAGAKALAEQLALESVEAAELSRQFGNVTMSIRGFNEQLNAIAQSNNFADMISKALEDPFSAEAAAKRKKYNEDIAMAGTLARNMADQDLVNKALSPSTAKDEAKAYMDQIIKDAGRTREEVALQAEAQRIYNDALERGVQLSQAEALATAKRAAAAEKAANPEKEKAARKPKKSEAEKEEDKFASIQNRFEDRLITAEAEAAAFGMSERAAAAFRYELELLNEARQKGISLSPAQRQELAATAAALANAEQKVRDLEQAEEDRIAALDEFRGFAKDAMSGFIDDLRNGASAGEALLNVLDKLVSKLADMALDHFVEALFGKTGTAQSGVFPGLASNLTGAPASAPAVQTQQLTAAAAEALQTAATGMRNAPAPLGGATGAGLRTTSRFNGAIDPRLKDILNEAAMRSAYTVQATSGLRTGKGKKGYHPKGLAADVQLIDPSGNALDNYQNASSFRAYEKFAQTARMVQMEKYPELNNEFRWGGYFGGPKGKYGALDSMHFDLGGKSGMAGGSWAGGLNQSQRALWPGIESVGMGSQPATQAAQALETLATKAEDAGSKFGDLTPALDSFSQKMLATGPGAAGVQPGTWAGGAAPPMDLGALAGSTAAPAGGAGGIGGMISSLLGSLGGIFQNLIGALLGGLGGGGGLGGILQGIFGMLFHSGGTVGATTAGRMVPAGAFAGAPRYHSGFRSDELPAILQKGERVLTERQWDRSKGMLTGLAVDPANQMQQLVQQFSSAPVFNIAGDANEHTLKLAAKMIDQNNRGLMKKLNTQSTRFE